MLQLVVGVSFGYPILSHPDKRSHDQVATQGFRKYLDSGKSERALGHTNNAAELFLKAAAVAQTPQQRAQAYLLASGSQIRLYQYRAALESDDASLKEALLAHDNTLAGAAYSNRATIYLLFGANHLALDASRRAVNLLEGSPRKEYLVKALLNDGDVASKLGDLNKAREELETAISIARQSKLQVLEAVSEDRLGQVLLDRHDLAGATKAYERAKALELSLNDYDDLAATKQHLADLSYQQGHYRLALAYLHDADASGGANFSATPSYWSPQLRAEILLKLGRRYEALVNFRRAVHAANHWRLYALPGDLTTIQTAATLHTVYREFVDLGGQIALERHDQALASECLAVLAESRAATLREQQTTTSLERQIELPPIYFSMLKELQGIEAKLDLGVDEGQKVALTESLQRTRNELAGLEDRVGISHKQLSVSNHSRISVASIQRSLNSDQLLLSFSLGEKTSFMWGVSRTRLELYRLPAESIIASHAVAYLSAMQESNTAGAGETLSRDLIGQLDAALATKPQWLIVADGVLLDRVPFAALPVPQSKNEPDLLIHHHSLRFLANEQLDDQHSSNNLDRFIGIADPIYNLADDRLPSSAKAIMINQARSGIMLARLPGSAVEIRSASKNSGMTNVELLTGANASVAKLQAALSAPPVPSVLHFAVHVISAARGQPGMPGDSALALSLTSGVVPELLTKEAIARFRVPGALVVLSGCTSQAGDFVPTAGLIGLGRAWLLAGASAVIVSAWPTPDDSGAFFLDFYTHLRTDHKKTESLVAHVAFSLQETQKDMEHGAGFRSTPSFWAGYSIFSDE